MNLSVLKESDVLSYSKQASTDQKATGIASQGSAKLPWLSGRSTLEKMDMVEAGVPKSVLEQFKQRAGLDYDMLASLLKVSRVKLISKKAQDRFDPDVSDKIMAVADIYAYGFEVFGEDDKFKRWIHKPNYTLGGRIPFELMINSYGRQEVRDLIGRIDYGVYS